VNVVLQKVSSTKKLREWQAQHVRLLWRFREFVKLEEQARKARDDGMRRHWWDKRTKAWNKFDNHEKSAPKEAQVEELTKTVMGMINKGTPLKQILEELGISKERKR